MGRGLTDIMEGDEMWDIRHKFLEACGIYLKEYLKNKSILNRSLFEQNFSKILKIVEEEHNNNFGYQALGYFILRTGSKLPEKLKKKIIDSTDFNKYEKNYWRESVKEERQEVLRDFRKRIEKYRVSNTH